MKTTEKDLQTSNKSFGLGENVKIKKISDEQKNEMKAEDYFYLKKFENRIGTISEQQQTESGVHTFRVEFDNSDFGYFYSKDLSTAQ